MANIRIPFGSAEYIRVQISAKEAGLVVDPTTPPLVVEMAFTAGAEPTVWTAAAWEKDGKTFFARVLVGGTGSGAAIQLARGRYVIWVRITVAPEKPILSADNMLEVV